MREQNQTKKQRIDESKTSCKESSRPKASGAMHKKAKKRLPESEMRYRTVRVI